MKVFTTRVALLALTALTLVDTAAAQTRRRYLPDDVRDSVERSERPSARRLPPNEVDNEVSEQDDIESPRVPQGSSRPGSMPRQPSQATPPVFAIYDDYRNFCGHFVADTQGTLYRVLDGGEVIPQPEGRLVRQHDARTFLAVNLAGQPYIALRIR
ncbi:MAG: hypothetical protein K1X67_15225 [Fimbriimonadaceae bacterium]|nr:hypothetical protein [Fimbriimonadaceae bacterium]